jgi:hypothetical protein
MKMKILLPIFLFLIIMPLAIAEEPEICIDKISPSAPSSLVIADSPYDSDGNIKLSWTAATDQPECSSGIDHYKIYRGIKSGFPTGEDSYIGSTSDLSFYDSSSLPEGYYCYKVTAVDKVEFAPNEGPAVEGCVTVGKSPQQPSNNGGSSTGSNSGNFLSCKENWTCSDWSSCSSQGTQTRSCADQSKCGTTKNKPLEAQNCEYTTSMPLNPVVTPYQASCGNNECEQGEGCGNCPEDCGKCTTIGINTVETAGIAGAGNDLLGFIIANPYIGFGGFVILLIILGLLMILGTRGGKKQSKGYEYEPKK